MPGVYKITVNFQTGTFKVEKEGTTAPAVYPPTGDVFITGKAVGPWTDPFPDKWKFTKESETLFTLTVSMTSGKNYQMVSNTSWDQAYNWPADVVLEDATLTGTFIEDGNKAHDINGNEIERWEGVKPLSPAEDGNYKITLNFQTGTYTLEKQ